MKTSVYSTQSESLISHASLFSCYRVQSRLTPYDFDDLLPIYSAFTIGDVFSISYFGTELLFRVATVTPSNPHNAVLFSPILTNIEVDLEPDATLNTRMETTFAPPEEPSHCDSSATVVAMPTEFRLSVKVVDFLLFDKNPLETLFPGPSTGT